MELLKKRILEQGKNLGKGVLKVDGFINHMVDPSLMDACGAEFARQFAGISADLILTAEISGIGPAVMTAKYMGLPVVYARKSKPVTMPGTVYLTVAPSHTKGNSVELIVSPEFLPKNAAVLIIDDFLASGETILGLARLTSVAGAKLVGVGTLIEKEFEGGREKLQHYNVPVKALVTITNMDDGQIVFAE